jgi:hypothetical protein
LPRKPVSRLSEVLRAIDEVDDDAVTNRQRSSERTSVRPSRGNVR